MQSIVKVYEKYNSEENTYYVTKTAVEYDSEEYFLARTNYTRIKEEAEKRKAKIVLLKENNEMEVLEDYSKVIENGPVPRLNFKHFL